ncbi:MAG: hypothetical protein II719_00080 [Clostridia bacterium]|nr:hypothetical protein [Clostridia bacterium]
MTVLSHVCAQFCDKTGKAVFTIRANELMKPLYNVPVEIQRDPLFGWLVSEHLLEVLADKKPEKTGGTRSRQNDSEEDEKPSGGKNTEKKT